MVWNPGYLGGMVWSQPMNLGFCHAPSHTQRYPEPSKADLLIHIHTFKLSIKSCGQCRALQSKGIGL